ncbi:MAG TPA: CDP-alcohol phosphatidyltransferase family protein [Polyangiaceae bacterium]|jgi:phosphatidylglycerophosphate synthase|nr:CDP-alcohol phosphatidyltransferase family protein [Polyangiaceae bacterium]
MTEPRASGFWAPYFASLKPLEVEEPIDVWVHRPPAYVLARMLMPTAISPNMVTVGSILLGLCAGVLIFAQFPHHLPIAGVLIFGSAVFDCADGQLARMRKSSSAFGRMLDGVADLVATSVVIVGGAWLLIRKYEHSTWQLALALGLAAVTIVTSSFHTTMYDQFKNSFLRMTHPSYREGEDVAVAEERHRAERAAQPLVIRLVWQIYLFYIRSQENYGKKFDPYAERLARQFSFNPRNAAIYRKHAAAAMRVWRDFFGFGSLVFGLAVSIGCDITDYYLLFRLVVLNAIFYGYLRPAQRRASERAFEEMASAV